MVLSAGVKHADDAAGLSVDISDREYRLWDGAKGAAVEPSINLQPTATSIILTILAAQTLWRFPS